MRWGEWQYCGAEPHDAGEDYLHVLIHGGSVIGKMGSIVGIRRNAEFQM